MYNFTRSSQGLGDGAKWATASREMPGTGPRTRRSRVGESKRSTASLTAGTRRRRGALGLSSLLVALSLVLVMAAAAQAETGYSQVGGVAIPPGASFGTPDLPAQVAVNDATGEVLVVDRPMDRVLVFDGAGATPALIAEFGNGELSGPYGIAVDQGSGDVYVSDEGSSRIVRYTSDGAPTPTYTPDPTYTSPPAGAGPGQIGSFGSPLAIDPITGDLLVADRGRELVSRFTTSGSFVSSFDGTGSPGGRFVNLLGLTVAPAGDIYLIDLNGKVQTLGEGQAGRIYGTSRVERFSSSGAADGALSSTSSGNATAIAYDANAENVLIGSQWESYEFLPPLLTVFHDDTIVAELPVESVGTGTSAVGLAVRTGGTDFAYFLTGSPFGIFGETASLQTFEPVTIPGVRLDPPIGASAEGVSLAGTVNPAGGPTQYRFEYSEDGGTTWTATSDSGVGSGEAPVPVATQLTGLEPSQRYLVKLVAYAEGGSPSPCRSSSLCSQTQPRSFETIASPPIAVTGGSSELTADSAYLSGTVNPRGLQATYHFEYGTSTAYGAVSPAVPAVVGNGRKPVNAGARLVDLQPGVEYHYRLVAESAGGRGEGVDHTFVTSGAGPTRAYELVSPVDKENRAIAPNDLTTPLVRADGNSIVYGTAYSTYPGAEAAPYAPRVVSTRSDSGWVTKTIDVPMTQITAGFHEIFFSAIAVSEDQTRALVASTRKLTPEAVEEGGRTNLYVKDLRSGALTFVGSSGGDEQSTSIYSLKGHLKFIGASSDLRTIVFAGETKWLPEAQAEKNIYEWREGRGLSLVSVDPSGSPFSENTREAGITQQNPNQVSADGSTTYFYTEGGPQAGLYRHHRGQPTQPISVSQRPGDPNTTVPAEFFAASADGEQVVFSAKAQLTVDAPAGVEEYVYLYDAASENLTYLAANPFLITPIFASDGVVYQETSTNALFYAHDGTKREIAGKAAGVSLFWASSPDGHYYAFEASGDVTGFDSKGFREVYRFDTVTEKTVCVSCRTDGGQATGKASLGREGSEILFEHHGVQAVNDDGTVLFDTPDPLLPADVNSTRDVYTSDGDQLELISSGDSDATSELLGMSPDGSDVFFKTDQQLVPDDRDSATDVYDARVGGGFASPAQTGQCEGDDCRTVIDRPASSAPGSEAVQGTTRSNTQCRKGRHLAGKGSKAHCVKLKKQKHKAKKHGRGKVRGHMRGRAGG
jgi:hypothetical protein